MTEPYPRREQQLNQAQYQHVNDISLYALFRSCRTTFMEFFVVLASEESQVSHTSLALISDEYGRLGVWGGNSGADRTGRGSLDDRLRNDTKVQGMISQLLKSLHSCLVKGVEIAKSPLQTTGLPNEDLDALSVNSSSGSDNSSTLSGPYDGSRSSMESLLRVIFGQVQALYESSAILRRPAIPDKYIRSAAKEKTSVSNTFGFWDRVHVAEKITQWHLDNGRKLEEPLKADYDYLCARLGAGNTRRREQLKHWQSHPEQGSSARINTEAPLPAPKEPPTRLVQAKSLPEVAAFEKNVAISVTLSKNTVQSFSTVAQSVLKDTATVSGSPKTMYAPSDHRPLAKELCLPDFPKSDPGAMTVACPYCFTQLNVKEMTAQRQLWKKHVFRDLRPYMCTFENCTHSEKLYVTRHDWIFHETQMHRREWTCKSCDESFKLKSAMEEHMRNHHAGNLTEKQLPIFLDLCERAVDLNELTECPLCEKILPLAKLRDQEDLQGHLAWHLEQIALFVLPVNNFDTEDSNEGNSNQAIPPMGHDADETEIQSINSASYSDFVLDDASADQGPARNTLSSLVDQGSDPTNEQVQFQVRNWCEGSTSGQYLLVSEAENAPSETAASQDGNNKQNEHPEKANETAKKTLGSEQSNKLDGSNLDLVLEGQSNNYKAESRPSRLSTLFNRLSRQPESYEKKSKYQFGRTLYTDTCWVVSEAEGPSGKVAIKAIFKNKIKGEESQIVFGEIKMLQWLKHPNIIRYVDWFESKDKHYIVTQFASGWSLFDRIVEEGKLTEQDALQTIRQILEVLNYFNDNDVVYGDLKPENLFYLAKNKSELVLMNFGTAQKLDSKNDVLTSMVGSFGYAAPELMLKRGYGKPADMWSLGVVTYAILSGYSPFRSDNLVDMIDECLNFRVVFHKRYWTNISGDAKNFICGLLQPDPKDRLSSKEALTHPWIIGKERPDDTGPTEIKAYVARARFRRAIRFIKLANRIEMLKMQEDWAMGAILREVVLAKICEVKEQEQVLKFIEEVKERKAI